MGKENGNNFLFSDFSSTVQLYRSKRDPAIVFLYEIHWQGIFFGEIMLVFSGNQRNI